MRLSDVRVFKDEWQRSRAEFLRAPQGEVRGIALPRTRVNSRTLPVYAAIIVPVSVVLCTQGPSGTGRRRGRLVLRELLPHRPGPCPRVHHAGDQLIEPAPPAGLPEA